MKSRPILFSGPMVRAVLEGRKTMTRRVIKHHLPAGPCDIRDVGNGPEIYGAGGAWLPLKCPYGKPGDRLYVRETFMDTVADDNSARSVVAYKADGTAKFALADNEGEGDFCGVTGNATPWITPEHKWRPSIHMPRWASRITLEVTDVRVERVQDIKCHDIRKEGFDCPKHDFPGGFCCSECVALRNEFLSTWNNLNAKRGFGWDSNPWVWCVSFRRVADA